jgi:hypothetical protein
LHFVAEEALGLEPEAMRQLPPAAVPGGLNHARFNYCTFVRFDFSITHVCNTQLNFQGKVEVFGGNKLLQIITSLSFIHALNIHLL